MMIDASTAINPTPPATAIWATVAEAVSEVRAARASEAILASLSSWALSLSRVSVQAAPFVGGVPVWAIRASMAMKVWKVSEAKSRSYGRRSSTSRPARPRACRKRREAAYSVKAETSDPVRRCRPIPMRTSACSLAMYSLARPMFCTAVACWTMARSLMVSSRA